MTFLNPAILIGLLAASVPVIIHLLNLKKLKTIEFSTLMFLKELQKNKIRKIKIKQWLLLFLRVLIIVFIVLSFARPTLKGITLAGVTSGAKTTSVFLIDNTFSMSVIDQQGSLFNQAKNLTEKLISFHQEGDELFVAFTADDSISQLNFNSSDFLSYFKNNNISYLKSDLRQNLISASEFVNKSKNFNREIFILSDFQKNNLPQKIEQSDLSELFNERIKIYLVPFTKEDIFNLSIDDIKPENQIIQKNSVISFIVTVTNHSKQNLQNRVVSLFINDMRVAQKSFSINANETQKINIETTLYSEGHINVFAEIEADDIEYDNRNYLSIYLPEKISVLLLTNQKSNPDFLKIALKTIPDNKIQIDEKDIRNISSVNFNSYDIAILISENFDNATLLKNYVEQGNSLIIIPPSNLNFQNFNSLVQNFGIGKFDNFITAQTNVNIRFDKVDYEHPVFKDLFANNQQRRIDSPVLAQFLKSSSLGGTTIISLSDNSKFLSEHRLGKGKIFLFNSAFDLSWSDFPFKSIYAPLIVKSVFYLSQKDFSTFQLKVGDEFFINLNKLSASKIIVKRPDETEDYFQLNELNSDIFKYNKTDLAGVYKVLIGEQLITTFAVNHHIDESKPEYLTITEFEKFLESLNFLGKTIQIKAEQNITEQINQARFGTELWKLFILMAVIIAIIEMIISRNNKKEIQSLTENISI